MQYVSLVQKVCISSSYRKMQSWGSGSVVDYLPETHKALIPSIIKTKTQPTNSEVSNLLSGKIINTGRAGNW